MARRKFKPRPYRYPKSAFKQNFMKVDGQDVLLVWDDAEVPSKTHKFPLNRAQIPVPVVTPTKNTQVLYADKVYKQWDNTDLPQLMRHIQEALLRGEREFLVKQDDL